jgi:hypothetical protein
MNLASIAIKLLGSDDTDFTLNLAKAVYGIGIYLGKNNQHHEAWVAACAGRETPAELPEGTAPALQGLAKLDVRPLQRLEHSPLNATERSQLLNLAAQADAHDGDDNVATAWRSLGQGLGFIYLLAAQETGYGNIPDHEARELARVFQPASAAPRALGGEHLELMPLAGLANRIWLDHILPEVAGTRTSETPIMTGTRT